MINVELTAGGGGKSENRITKVRERNKELFGQRVSSDRVQSDHQLIFYRRRRSVLKNKGWMESPHQQCLTDRKGIPRHLESIKHP